MSFFVLAMGLGTGACTSKEPVVDTGLTPPTDPNSGTPTTSTYNGAAVRNADRGWRLVQDTADWTIRDPKLRDPKIVDPAGSF